ncbi:helix-turn-helix domain-containing protein [Nocardia sp. NPDC050710]|uniref:IclR family transcriptional regulator n=1 Tax=Nocardia sp. NPDC050710 TaxID=3157220 RepID=UPI0034081F53
MSVDPSSNAPDPHPGAGRGVLDSGFQVLQAISEAPEGCGLSRLARATGLPKATAYRLAEQLVALGAVHRVQQRYFVGARLAELGRRWQAAPMLRRAAQRPGRILAALTESTVAVCVLDQGAIHMVAGFNGAEVFLSAAPDNDLAFRTALAQVLLAGRVDRAVPPPTYSAGEWRRVRTGIEDTGMIAVDHYQMVRGICCAAAAIQQPGTPEVAAIACMSLAPRFPPALPGLVAHAAREIEKNLR